MAAESIYSDKLTRNAFATLVMLGDNYVAGALTLAQSLIDTKTSADIICLVDDAVSADARERLRRLFTEVIEIATIEIRATPLKSAKQRNIYGSWVNKSVTKWHIMNPALTARPYSKILFLDADVVVRHNIDELFDIPAPAACWSSPWSEVHVKLTRAHRFTGGLQDFFAKDGVELDHGAVVSAADILAALDYYYSGTSKSLTTSSFIANGSSILIEPSEKLWQIFLDEIREFRVDVATDTAPARRYGNIHCSGGSDEQVLSRCILRLGNPISHIHQRYGWYAGKTDWLDDWERNAAVIHYVNEKPWDSRDSWPDVAIWWEIYDRVTGDELAAGIRVTELPPPSSPSPPSQRQARGGRDGNSRGRDSNSRGRDNGSRKSRGDQPPLPEWRPRGAVKFRGAPRSRGKK